MVPAGGPTPKINEGLRVLTWLTLQTDDGYSTSPLAADFLAHLLIPFTPMLKDAERHCDICDTAITKGDRYFTVLVPRDSVPPNADIPRSGLAVDALGNVRVDMCEQCKTGMGLSGEEVWD